MPAGDRVALRHLPLSRGNEQRKKERMLLGQRRAGGGREFIQPFAKQHQDGNSQQDEERYADRVKEQRVAVSRRPLQRISSMDSGR